MSAQEYNLHCARSDSVIIRVLVRSLHYSRLLIRVSNISILYAQTYIHTHVRRTCIYLALRNFCSHPSHPLLAARLAGGAQGETKHRWRILAIAAGLQTSKTPRAFSRRALLGNRPPCVQRDAAARLPTRRIFIVAAHSPLPPPHPTRPAFRPSSPGSSSRPFARDGSGIDLAVHRWTLID